MNEKFMEDSDDMVAVNVVTICPSCNHKLHREKREDKRRAKMASSKLKFIHHCNHHSGCSHQKHLKNDNLNDEEINGHKKLIIDDLFSDSKPVL